MLIRETARSKPFKTTIPIPQNAWVKDHYSNVGDWAKAASDLFTEMQDKTTGWF